MNLVLIGFKACGKTSLAKALDEFYIDTDDLIQNQHLINTGQQLSCATIYRSQGEKYFRALEKTVIAELDKKPSLHRVIATGGGSVFDATNVENLQKHGKLIYLYTPSEIIFARFSTLPAYLNSYAEFLELYTKRDIVYQQIADRVITTTNKSIAELALELSHGE
jgi:shikimate kinase